MYCTIIDTRRKSDLLLGKDEDTKEYQIIDEDILLQIEQADSIIDSYLESVYPNSPFGINTWAKRPVRWEGNATNSTLVLRNIYCASSATTEYWTIEVTSDTGDTAFTLTGSESGAKGNGTVASDFVSDGGTITIPTSSWTGSSVYGDKIFFSTCNVYRIINTISTLLSCAYSLETVYSGEESNATDYIELFEKRAMKMLDDLGDPDRSKVMLPCITETTTHQIHLEWDIDKYGEDLTTYDKTNYE